MLPNKIRWEDIQRTRLFEEEARCKGRFSCCPSWRKIRCFNMECNHFPSKKSRYVRFVPDLSKMELVSFQFFRNWNEFLNEPFHHFVTKKSRESYLKEQNWGYYVIKKHNKLYQIQVSKVTMHFVWSHLWRKQTVKVMIKVFLSIAPYLLDCCWHYFICLVNWNEIQCSNQ